MSDFAAIILAAGKSTRMKSKLPKAAHKLCGKPMTRHIIDACRQAGVDQIVVVVGHEAEKVKAALGSDVTYVLQEKQLGTGHACRMAMPALADHRGDIIVLPGDTPLITPEALKLLTDYHKEHDAALTLLTAVLPEGSHYGRIVRTGDGRVEKIVEAKDATSEILAIREISTSMYCFKKGALEEKLKLLSTDNAQGEYYLTDTVGLLANSGEYVGAVVAERAEDTLGINNRVELAEATAILKKRVLDRLMLSGVTVEDTATTFIDADVEIGKDTVIKPCTILESGTVIGEDCVIGPFVRLAACRLGNNVTASQVSIVNEIISGPAELGQNGGKLWSSANSLERS